MAFDYTSVIPLIANVWGMFGASSAARRAREERNRVLGEFLRMNDEGYQNLVSRNARSLMGQAGVGGDAIRALGSNLGAAGANAGVYNSSAVAGMLAQAQQNENQSLAQQAVENRWNEQDLLNQNKRFALNAQLGLAGNDYNDARENLAGVKSGLASSLGTLVQQILASRGVPNANRMGAATNGKSSVLDVSPVFDINTFRPQAPVVWGMGSANYNPKRRFAFPSVSFGPTLTGGW